MATTSNGFDSTISLNLSSINASRTSGVVAGNYDLQAVATHEIDEALGIGGPGSTLADGSGTGTPAPTTLGPLDFFRYSAPGVRSFTYDNSTTAYFSIDGGHTNLVYFNQQGTNTATNGSDYADFGAPPNTPGGEDQGNTPPLVQDAFGASSPAVSPNLSTLELTALQVVGYNLTHSPIYWAGPINGAWTLQNWASDTGGASSSSIPSDGLERRRSLRPRPWGIRETRCWARILPSTVSP